MVLLHADVTTTHQWWWPFHYAGTIVVAIRMIMVVPLLLQLMYTAHAGMATATGDCGHIDQ